MDGDKDAQITVTFKAFCIGFILRWSLMTGLESLPWI